MARDAFFDNAKFLLIVLVVFGHIIRSYIEDYETILTLYKVIYTFHMPAFILIAGYFAKGFQKKGYLQKISKKLLIPYLIFQLIYSVFYYLILDQSTFQVDPLNPHWSLWFLISLFYWNLMLLLYTKWKPVFALLIAFTIGLAVGYIDWITSYLSLSRTFVFFPLFLLGFYLKKEHFKLLSSWKVRLFSLCMITVVTIFFVINPTLNEKWLLGSKPYEELGAFGFEGLLSRAFVYGICTIMVFCFLSFVPRQRLFFTDLGKNTLYVYLLHGFIIKTFRASDIQYEFHSTQNILLLAGLALVLTLLLSSKVVVPFFQPFIELKRNQLQALVGRMKGWANMMKKRADQLFSSS